MKKQKGITLIALVITIIILIILAGVAINLTLGDNGIFNKAKLAKEKYNEENIREKVELGIMELEIDEMTLGNQVTIESVLQELLEKEIFETIDKDAAVGNIGEYEVKLKYNENQKVEIDYIAKATGVRVTYKLNPESYTNGEKVGILLTVNGKVKSVTKPDNLVIYPENETLAINYQVTANGTYKFIIESEDGSKQEKNVVVDTIDRLLPNDFTITGENIEGGIKITANAIDAESDGISVKSGIDRYEYFIKGESDTEYLKYETNEITGLKRENYSIYVIAYDKAGNSKTSNTITMLGVEILISDLKAGDYIKYDSGTNGIITCRVLYPVSSEYGLQIISDESVKDVTLASVNTSYAKSKSIYNNAIVTLNNEAEKYINTVYAYDARCVGSNPTINEKGIMTEKNKEVAEQISIYGESGFYPADTNYIIDKNQMTSVGMYYLASENYWLASRDIDTTTIPGVSYLGIRACRSGRMDSGTTICRLAGDGSKFGYDYKEPAVYGFRPCISLKSDEIKIIGGTGENEQRAYIIGL